MKDSGSSDDAKFRANRTFICSVVFLDIVEYSKKPVVEQISVKEKFNSIVAECLKDIPVSDRIILDTGDGAAIGFMSDPEDALFVAMGIRNLLCDDEKKHGDLLVRMGINLGPVRILKDINKQMNLIGDGINVAQRIMSFAEPGQLLVSRSYYDIVSCLSGEYAKLFQYKGAKADKHVREHDIYSVENTGLLPASSLHHDQPIEKSEAATKPEESFQKPKHSETAVRETSRQKMTVARNEVSQATKRFIGIGIAALILIVSIGFMIIKSPNKVSDSPTYTKSTAKEEKRTEKKEIKGKGKKEEKKVEEEQVPDREIFKSASMKADGIDFSLISIKKSGDEVSAVIRIHNTSNTNKSVAIYDDYVRWPKSTLVDKNGKSHEVNKVMFTKDGKTMASQAAGTQGLSISPGQMITVSLTFKNAGKGSRKFMLHPFVYTGRSWTEHNLLMKSDI